MSEITATNPYGAALYNPRPALETAELAAPGPHPAEATDARNYGGSYVAVPDDWPTAWRHADGPGQPHQETSLPGPDPNDASDAGSLGGDAWKPGGDQYEKRNVPTPIVPDTV